MANKKLEDYSLDTMQEEELIEVPKPEAKTIKREKVIAKPKEEEPVNCLRNERIIVRHIPRQTGMRIENPKHVAYGGMLETAVKTFCVPMLEKGQLVNVLTNEEKACLEELMGLEYNALSIYKKNDNYWHTKTVSLRKQDNYFDLSVPEQYIEYKILLANKEYIASSLQELEDYPKATYQFVIINSGEEERKQSTNMSTTMECYKEFGKIEDDIYTLRVIIEALDGRPTASNSKIDFLRTKINNLIQANSKLFLSTIKDPLLPIKVLIKKSVEAGTIVTRGNLYYLVEGKTRVPLCEDGEEPTYNKAAKYLSVPKRSEMKFMLEAKLKQ